MARQRFGDLGKVGLITDVVETALPAQAWNHLVNVLPQDGALGPPSGVTKLFELDCEPLYHTVWRDVDGEWWAVASDGISVWIYDIQGMIGASPTAKKQLKDNWTGGYVTFAHLNGVLVINSKTDGPLFYRPSDQTLQTLPGWGATWRCDVMAAFRYSLFALGMTEGTNYYPHKLRWSTAAAEGAIPAVWDPTTLSESAGDDLIGETQGRIIGAVQGRDRLFILKTDAIYEAVWIGGNYTHKVSRLHGGLSTKFPRGFYEMSGGVAIFNATEFAFFDGQNVNSLVEQKVRTELFSKVPDDNWYLCSVYVHHWTSQAIVGLLSPGNRALTDAYIYNYQEGTWGHMTLRGSYGFDSAQVRLTVDSRPWDDYGASGFASQIEPGPKWLPGTTWDGQDDAGWDKGTYISAVPDILIYESDVNDTAGPHKYWVSVVDRSHTQSDNSVIPTEALRTGLPIEGADGLAMVRRIWPEIEGNCPVHIEVGGQYTMEQAPNWTQKFKVNPQENASIAPRVTGRFLSFRVTSADKGWWRLAALTVDWERAGER